MFLCMFQYVVVFQAAIALTNQGCQGSDTKCAFNFLKHTQLMYHWNKITNKVKCNSGLN